MSRLGEQARIGSGLLRAGHGEELGLIRLSGELGLGQPAKILDATHQHRLGHRGHVGGFEAELLRVLHEELFVALAAAGVLGAVDGPQAGHAAVAAQHLAGVVNDGCAEVRGGSFAEALRLELLHDARNLVHAGLAGAVSRLQGGVKARVETGHQVLRLTQFVFALHGHARAGRGGGPFLAVGHGRRLCSRRR